MANDERVRGNVAGPIAASVAANVAARRQELGLTRRELAERLRAAGRRFTPDAVQKLEANGRRCDVDDLVTLASVLDTTAGELLGLSRAERRSTMRDKLELADRNPLLRKGLTIAVITNSEDRALLLDYVDDAARSWPAVVKFVASHDEWVATLRKVADPIAAQMIAEEYEVDGVNRSDISLGDVAAWVGDDRAEAVHAAIRDQGGQSGEE